MINWSPGVTLDQMEEQIIMKALQHYRGNKTVTASALGVSIKTLDNKLERYFAQMEEDKLRAVADRAKRDEFLARCRGKLPASEMKEASQTDKSELPHEIQESSLKRRK